MSTMTRGNKLLCALYVAFLAIATIISCISAANAQPVGLSPEELGVIDALIMWLGTKWEFIQPFAAAGYLAALVRTMIPKKWSTKNGVQWFFWLWDRIAANYGGAKNEAAPKSGDSFAYR